MSAKDRIKGVLLEVFGKTPTGDADIPQNGGGNPQDGGGANPQGQGQPQDGGAGDIPEADVIAAMQVYQKIPDWKKILDEAPENARNRIALNLYFTECHDKPGFNRGAYLELRRELEAQMTHDDLEYLITTSKNEAATKHYRELLMQLPDGGTDNPPNQGGQPQDGGGNSNPPNPNDPPKDE